MAFHAEVQNPPGILPFSATMNPCLSLNASQASRGSTGVTGLSSKTSEGANLLSTVILTLLLSGISNIHINVLRIMFKLSVLDGGNQTHVQTHHVSSYPTFYNRTMSWSTQFKEGTTWEESP
jgi:hypothetical protein